MNDNNTEMEFIPRKHTSSRNRYNNGGLRKRIEIDGTFTGKYYLF